MPCSSRENLPGHFKFKEYCPRVFHDLRKRFRIDDLEYMVRDSYSASELRTWFEVTRESISMMMVTMRRVTMTMTMAAMTMMMTMVTVMVMMLMMMLTLND